MTEAKRPVDPSELREKVRDGYAAVARGSSCCGGDRAASALEHSKTMGYSAQELAKLPEGANLGVGCGNPTALAEIEPGETVLDLGSGAGIDCFLAADKVGPEGRVIGVDMTDDMLERARAYAAKTGATNVEFRKGIIEDLPVEDSSIDLIISNCVINLSPQKDRVFAEAYRVLKPGGRLLISDIVLERSLPPEVVSSVDAYIGCISGAVLREDYLQTMQEAGLGNVEILSADNYGSKLDDERSLAEMAKRLSIDLEQVKEFLPAITSLKLRATKGA